MLTVELKAAKLDPQLSQNCKNSGTPFYLLTTNMVGDRDKTGSPGQTGHALEKVTGSGLLTGSGQVIR